MIKDILKALRDYAGGLAAPDLCPVCGSELLEGEYGICLQCLMALPRCLTGSRQPLTEFLSNGVAPEGIAASWFRYDPLSSMADGDATARNAAGRRRRPPAGAYALA